MRMTHTKNKTILTATGLALTAIAATALAAAGPADAAPRNFGPCESGRLCLWEKEEFKGKRHTYELAGTDIESCIALPDGTAAAALVNRTGRPVTTYQSATCAETGEFETYPGGGTWVPRSPYQVRAFKIWEN
ncbi:peptidase inhibitor family I36 protein [Streptomyces coeruleoprunus]|uniref:Peptidase inhibitor family I36 protein n=1 Tax=Streptomyces coeruleoprunus TaxID=285563 RepID=A0ABV9X7W7_9ACTN